MELKNDYPNKKYTELEKLSKDVFEKLNEEIKKDGKFEPVKQEYNPSWESVKGELHYQLIENDREQARLNIKFSTAYPSLRFDYRNGYIKAKAHLSSNIFYLDKKILDKLKAVFHSHKDEGGRSKPLKITKKKIKIIRRFRNDYPGKSPQELGKLSKKIFQNLETLLKEHENFKFIKRKYVKKHMFGDWNVAKGELSYKILEDDELQSDFKIRLLAAYPPMCMVFEKGYIQIKAEAYTIKGGDFEEKIFDELETKIRSFREEGKNEGKKEKIPSKND